MEQNAAKTLQEYLSGIELLDHPAAVVLELFRHHGLEGTRQALIEFEDSIKFINHHLETTYDEDLVQHLQQEDIVSSHEMLDVVIAYVGEMSRHVVRRSFLDSLDRNLPTEDVIKLIVDNSDTPFPANAETDGIFLDSTGRGIGQFWEDYDEMMEMEDNVRLTLTNLGKE